MPRELGNQALLVLIHVTAADALACVRLQANAAWGSRNRFALIAAHGRAAPCAQMSATRNVRLARNSARPQWSRFVARAGSGTIGRSLPTFVMRSACQGRHSFAKEPPRPNAAPMVAIGERSLLFPTVLIVGQAKTDVTMQGTWAKPATAVSGATLECLQDAALTAIQGKMVATVRSSASAYRMAHGTREGT